MSPTAPDWRVSVNAPYREYCATCGRLSHGVLFCRPCGTPRPMGWTPSSLGPPGDVPSEVDESDVGGPYKGETPNQFVARREARAVLARAEAEIAP